MSAPVTERARAAAKNAASRARTTTIPAQRGLPAGRARERVGPSHEPVDRRSATKAYARRDERARRIVGGRATRTAPPAGRAQFVLLNMVLLAAGLVATLWLSTAAAADSYRLQDARSDASALSERAERLHREVASMESAPELARRAAALGMVPVQDPARLVVAPDGSVSVVGTPRAAVGSQPAPPAVPGPPGSPAVPGAQPGQQAPGAPPEAGVAQLAAGTPGQQDPQQSAGQQNPAQDPAQQGAGAPAAATPGPADQGGAGQDPADQAPAAGAPAVGAPTEQRAAGQGGAGPGTTPGEAGRPSAGAAGSAPSDASGTGQAGGTGTG